MKKAFFICLSFVLINCKTNQTINGKREGVWITKFALDSLNNKFIFKTREVYKDGMPIKTWKEFLDGQLIKKEKYQKDLSAIITYYHPNGKIEKRGIAKTEISKKEVHWFYTGIWKYYNEEGKMTHVTYFENGLAIKTDSLKSN